VELITLHKHDKQWTNTFEMERDLIFSVISQYIDKIHHIGSTAVPDLLAKPIIDIAIEAKVFPPSQTVIDKLASIEFYYKGEAGIAGRHWFVKGQPRKFNLHYCSIGSDIVQNQIKLRDRLTNNEHFRREYEKVKIENYKDKDIDSSDYANSKSDLIHRILEQ
jgi:GrpB-like predicted nucleotidyltransferase (UPF0157 family)